MKCFADLATEKVREFYESISHYQSVWLPILAMEAASKTVNLGDTILCQNVRISLKKRNADYFGKLKLDLNFCKRRNVKIFMNSKDGEDEANDFLCIRFPLDHETVKKTTNKGKLCKHESLIRNIWVCHAVAKYISVNEDEDVALQFRVQHFNTPPPSQFLEAGKTGKPCTVEFLTKLLPDR